MQLCSDARLCMSSWFFTSQVRLFGKTLHIRLSEAQKHACFFFLPPPDRAWLRDERDDKLSISLQYLRMYYWKKKNRERNHLITFDPPLMESFQVNWLNSRPTQIPQTADISHRFWREERCFLWNSESGMHLDTLVNDWVPALRSKVELWYDNMSSSRFISENRHIICK